MTCHKTGNGPLGSKLRRFLKWVYSPLDRLRSFWLTLPFGS
jgi:hypothetical protein